MQNLHPLLLLWVKPRQTVQVINQTYSPLYDFRCVVWLTLVCFLQIALVIVINGEIPLTVFMTAKGLEGIVWAMIALAAGLYTYANLIGLMAWKLANWLGGVGSLAKTRTVLLWGMLSFLPVGFNLVLIYFAYTLKLFGQPLFLLGPLSLIAFPCLLVYSAVLNLKLFSEMHRIPIWRALIVLLLCFFVQGAVLTLLLSLRNT